MQTNILVSLSSAQLLLLSDALLQLKQYKGSELGYQSVGGSTVQDLILQQSFEQVDELDFESYILLEIDKLYCGLTYAANPANAGLVNDLNPIAP